MENIKKITEHTYGTHIYMKLEIDGKQYEVVVLTLANGRKIEICDFSLVDRLYAEAFRMKNK